MHRYRIHLNNVDSLVRFFLPYHETELFPRMLQLIDLLAHKNQKWAWLQPLKVLNKGGKVGGVGRRLDIFLDVISFVIVVSVPANLLYTFFEWGGLCKLLTG